jgi:hypothetical protein
MNGVGNTETGVASGIVNTSFIMGGAFGLAVLSSVVDVRTRELQMSGVDAVAALNGGYHFAFLLGALLVAAAALLGRLVLRPG